MFMGGLRIGAKVTLGYGVLIVILMCLVGFLTLLLFSINKNAQVLSGEALPLSGDSNELERNLLNMFMELRSYSLTEDSSHLAAARSFLPEADKRLKTIEDNLKKYSAANRREMVERLDSIKRQADEVHALTDGMEKNLTELQTARADFTAVRDEVYANDLYPFYDMIQEALALNYGLGEKESKDRLERYTYGSNEMWDNYEAANLTFWQGQAERSLVKIREATELILASARGVELLLAESDLSAETRAAGQAFREKYPAIEEAMNRFIATWEQRDANDARSQELMLIISGHLRTLANAADETSTAGAEQTRRDVSTALTASFSGLGLTLVIGLCGAFFISRGITSSIKGAIGRILSGAGHVERNAVILAGAAGTLSRGAGDNVASLQTITAALEELSAMTARNSQNAAQADKLMHEAEGDITSANGYMTDLITAMDGISSSGQAISEIIKTIDDIAFQTNLLALNAAVEAARAGDAGAGFAVVADEVRNLAIRSAESSRRTAELIDDTIKNISSGAELVRKTGVSFNRVGDGVGKVGTLLAEVAEASREQTQGIGQINGSMSEMDQVTKNNLSASNQAANVSSELADQSEELLDTVNDLSIMVYTQAEANRLNNEARQDSPPSPGGR
ncbi:hypothetical protein C4J81_04785 [Deltaproteobacteria bacterium Smac51]|nr:hypothetical protein C4J81_04785 [Deltaproteobacteria bacterium Smac51]